MSVCYLKQDITTTCIEARTTWYMASDTQVSIYYTLSLTTLTRQSNRPHQCRYIYTKTYMYTHTYMHIHISTDTHIYRYICTYTCIYIYNIYIYIYIYLHAFVYMYLQVHMYTYINFFIKKPEN